MTNLMREQRVMQLTHPAAKQPVRLDNVRLLQDFNAQSSTPVTMSQLQSMMYRMPYCQRDYEKWRDEIMAIVKKRKGDNEMDLQNGKQLHHNHDWTGRLTQMLTDLAREQRVQQFCDPTILKHPSGYNLDKMLEDLNLHASPPFTKKQIERKLYKSRIFISTDYEKWRNEIEDLASKRGVTTFVKPQKKFMTNGGRWTEAENITGQKVIEDNRGYEVTVLLEKLGEALENRTRVAIYASLN